MKVESITLHKCTRITLSNIETVTITMTELIQCILGTNGSGKSSILDALSPLPAIKADYAEGGYKDITIVHNDIRYQLVSRFDGKGSGRHEFWLGEQNLNEGGTGSVQRQLVLEHFEYTQELHDVITGRVLFTEMGAGVRRQWFTKMSTCDMSYIIGLHDKIKKEARDSVGAHKYIQERIAQESAKLMDAEELEKTRQLAQQMRDELKVLLEERVVAKSQEDVGLDKIDGLDDTIVHLCELIVNTNFDPITDRQGNSITNAADLSAIVKEHTSKRDSVATRIDSLSQEHHNLADLKEKVNTFDDVDIESVEAYIKEQEQLLSGVMARLGEYGDMSASPTDVMNTVDAIYPAVSETTTELLNYNATDCSKEILQAKEDQLADVKEKYSGLLEKQRRCNERIAHIERSDHVSCTKCGYTFKPGVQDTDLEKLKEYQGKYNEAEARGSALIEELQTRIGEIRRYQDLLRILSDICRNTPTLKEVWDAALGKELHKKDPSAILGELNAAHRDAALRKEVQDITAELEPRQKLASDYHMHKEKSLGSTAEFDRRLSAIDAEIDSLTSQLGVLNRERSDYVAVLNAWEAADDAITKVGYLVDERNAEALRVEEALRQREVCALTDGHHHRLAALENRLREAETVEDNIANLRDQESKLGFAGKAYPVMVEALGPVSGLIAQRLYSVIESITETMNQVIGSIWTVPMAVVPCGLENGELNYKFPIDRGTEKYAPDVSLGSEAQKEIINFAFRVSVYGRMGLQGWPLWVDELSSTFDEQHRSNTMTYLKDIMVGSDFSQMFLVSHYATNHGVFTNAEVCVLDDTNVAVPGKYNDHVVLK